VTDTHGLGAIRMPVTAARRVMRNS
jgi:hypothetical protein